MVSQEVKEEMDRSLKLPITSASDTELPTGEANTFIGWDAAGLVLENKSLPDPSILERASEADAKAGTDNSDYMTPLRTAQAVSTLDTLTITTSATIALLTAGNLTVTTSATIALLDVGLATAGTLTITTSATIELLTVSTLVATTTATVALLTASTISITGNIYTAAWADYGATSTIVGFTSYTSKEIYTKKIGKMVFVQYDFQGASNSTVLTFTLPFNMASAPPNIRNAMAYCSDNTTPEVGGYSQMTASGNVVSLFRPLGTAWTASGSKFAIGQFWYESA